MFTGPGNQRKIAPPQPTQNEAQAREKLLHYVYEFLVLNNAQKAAEVFKSEVFPNNPPFNITESPPGFLANWFSLFWDLYCGDPERRDKCNPTQEAKAFHDFGFVATNTQPQAPMMMPNRPPGFPMTPNMGMPPDHPYMMRPGMPPTNPYGQPPRPPVSHGFPPGPPGGAPMFPPQDMRIPASNRMRLPQPNMNYMRPRFGAPPYMDPQTAAANPHFSMPNGMPMPPPDMQHDPRYAAMASSVPTSMPPQFMPEQMPHPPVSMAPSTSMPNSMGMNGQMPPMPEVSQQGGPLPGLSNIMNGVEMKPSPSHHIGSVHAPNGTPGSMAPDSQHAQMMGPGSAATGHPPSVQSQPGQPGSVAAPSQPPASTQAPQAMAMGPGQQSQTPMLDNAMMDFQNDMGNPNPTPNSNEDLSEIKRIREGLLDDFLHDPSTQTQQQA